MDWIRFFPRDDEETYQQTVKTTLTTTTAICLLLDRAADVDEAVALLKQYDMNFFIDISHHLTLADATGKSVVVEYVNGKMWVTETKIVTNHYLTDGEKQGVGSVQSHQRFDTLAAYTGPASELEVRALLESVVQKDCFQTDGSYGKDHVEHYLLTGGSMCRFLFQRKISQKLHFDAFRQRRFFGAKR